MRPEKPDYRNWVPLGMIRALYGAIVGGLVLFAILTTNLDGTAKTVVGAILGIALVVLIIAAVAMTRLYMAFSYDGEIRFAEKIIDQVSDYVKLPEGGVGLDVGCGSAALTIACAKKNPQATMVGLDRWGKEYASFNRDLCEKNALAEKVEDRVSFVNGDAVKLDYPDESFDAVTSNYCYHNIPSKDRQAIILESLRVVKKGGTFAIHDEFKKGKYGDVNQLVKKIKDLGFEEVKFYDTSDGMFMTRAEAKKLFLVGSGLLVGKK